MKDQIISAYIKQCLELGKMPNNVYTFAKELGMEEKDFYTYFSSLEAVEMGIFQYWFEQVKNQTTNSEIYANYSGREKMLAIYFAWIEALKGNRSFVKMMFDKKQDNFPMPKVPRFLKLLRVDFIAFANALINEGIGTKEIEDRKFLSDKYKDGLWMNFLFVMNFWLKDDSPAFEKTDAAIEKSVNLAFDLMGKSPLDSMLDFGKFVFQNK
jgi:AcrR family transcriptional regulator